MAFPLSYLGRFGVKLRAASADKPSPVRSENYCEIVRGWTNYRAKACLGSKQDELAG